IWSQKLEFAVHIIPSSVWPTAALSVAHSPDVHAKTVFGPPPLSPNCAIGKFPLQVSEPKIQLSAISVESKLPSSPAVRPTLFATFTLPLMWLRSRPIQAPCHPVTSTLPWIVLSLIGKLTYGLSVIPGPPPCEITSPWIVLPSRYMVSGLLATM